MNVMGHVIGPVSVHEFNFNLFNAEYYLYPLILQAFSWVIMFPVKE